MAKGGRPAARTGARPTKARATPSRATAQRRDAVRATAVDRRHDVALVLLLASPVVIVPEALNRFVFGKLLVAALGVALALLVRPVGALSRLTQALLAGAGATLLLAALLADAPLAALAGRAQRYEGVLTVTLYVLAGVCGARLLGPQRTPRTERLATFTLAVVAGVVAFVAVLESTGLRPLSTNLDRPGGLLGNASDEGALAVLLAVVLTYLAVRRRHWRTGLGAGAALLTVALSASRGALLAVVAGLLLAVLLGSRRARLPVLGGLAGVALLSLLVPFTRSRVLNDSPLSQSTITGRHQLWSETLSLLTSHPLLGVGPSNFQVAITVEHDRRWQSTVGPANAPESPHNWLLQTLSAGGVVLLAIVVALLVVLVRTTWPRLRDRDPWTCALACALVGYGTALLFHLTSPSTTVVAAVLAGSLLARAPAAPRRPLARAVGVPVAAVLTLAFLLASVADIALRSATLDVARGDYAAADDTYGTARTLRPWDVDLPVQALHAFAVAAESGDQRAIPYGLRWYERSGAVGPDGQVEADHASLLESAGRFADALRVIDAALARDRDNPLLLLRRGILHAELKQYSPAEHDLREAASISTDSPEPWANLATLYRQQGRTADAAMAQRRADALQR